MLTFLKEHSLFIAVPIILLGIFLRVYQLGHVPAVSHRDETSIGYNAYSLLKTGQDEHGEPWPLNFKCFGDYKLPGLIYSTIPFIRLFGLTHLAVRLPTAIFAVLTLASTYWLLKQLKFSKNTSLVFLVLLSLSFWHISQARNAYEPMAGLFWTVLSWTAWLKAPENQKFYLVSLLSYGLGIFFYNQPLILLPLLFIGSTFLDREKYFRNSKGIVIASLIFVIAIGLGFSWIFREVNISRSQGSVFSSEEITQDADFFIHAGLVGGIPSIISRVSNHSLILASFSIAKNYAASFDLTYLFFRGDHNAWHNLRSIGLGNINPVLITPFLSGIYLILSKKKSTRNRLILLYFLASPLANALTIDAPITNRLLDLHLAILMIAALGTVQLFLRLKNSSLGRVILASLTLGYASITALFILRYFSMFNPLMAKSWYPEVNTMIHQVNSIQDQYDAIYITRNLNLGYTYFAFYTPFDPADFIGQAKWHQDGFTQVKQYNHYFFEDFPRWRDITLDNAADLFNNEVDTILVVIDREPVNQIKTEFSIIDWRSRWLWAGWKTDTAGAYQEISKLAINPERAKVLKYLESCLARECDEVWLQVN